MEIGRDLYLLGCNVLVNESLRLHTTFKLGGVVSLFVIPKTKEIFIKAIRYLKNKNIDFRIIGGGANLIVKDEYMDFIVVSTEFLTGYNIQDEYIYSEVGIPFSRLSYIAMENSLSGLEFACGIPGTLGGALFMNAGAYGGQISNIINEVEVFDLKEETIKKLNKEELGFDYRKSIFQERRYIALSAKLKMVKKEKYKINEKMKDMSIKRWKKQPLEYPSAGSIFKRPRSDFYVGTTIEKLGLKGYSIGGAQISKKHAGFIINKGNAKFSDVLNLINYVKKTVKNEYNVELEIEPEIWE
ncbi:UDP-N-acetylmuramate dehydrogenase [Marinitoga sp. 1155]|uniref:UDP-N-acetylmuramate dehydrogenase n=1 Tax=Marinitoga sp. 1155 TaxID=1428448 RepID=UPI0006414967|nr:UDP-N-acetylmuramate dehydrogenase [Marinitoga sp. 1155]